MIKIKASISIRSDGERAEALELSNQIERIMQKFLELPPISKEAALRKAMELSKEKSNDPRDKS